MHVGQQVLKKLQVSLAVEDHHRYAMRFRERTNNPCEVLGDDVAQ